MKLLLLVSVIVLMVFSGAYSQNTSSIFKNGISPRDTTPYISLNIIPEKTNNGVCEELNKEVDEFTGEITIQFDIYTEDNQVSFIKIINKKLTVYYLDIDIKETGIYTGTGVYLILKNGKKISKPYEKVNYIYLGHNFYSRAFIRLTAQDISLLKLSGLSKFKLYISTGQITDKSDYLKDLFNCLLKAK